MGKGEAGGAAKSSGLRTAVALEVGLGREMFPV